MNSEFNEIIAFLDRNIENECELNIVTKRISFRAINQLIPYFKKCKFVRILLTGFNIEDETNLDQRAYQINKNETELLTNQFELKLKNDLMDYSIAMNVKEIISSKIEIKSTNKYNNSFLNIKNSKNDYFTLMDCSEITLSSLGFVENDMFYNTQETFNGDSDYNFFNKMWKSTLNGDQVKTKIINKLESIFSNKTPSELYYFSLSRIFKNKLSEFDDNNYNQEIDFKSTIIYQKLYEFQKHGVHAIIDKINKYNGCILADSVGLGKTFEALAVIKYFELQHKKVLVLCPKKLSDNWNQFVKPYKTNFLLQDNFNYSVYHHTDLLRESKEFSQIDWSNFDLVVIDESHNFRNGHYNSKTEKYQSARYDKLMNEIILQGKKTAVLLLSATPVNNSMKDIKNQIYLITRNKDNAFEKQNIKSIKTVCQYAENKSKEWSYLHESERTPKKFDQMIGLPFKSMIDLITIARSRKQIEFTYNDLNFNFSKKKKPISIRPDIDSENKIINIKELTKELKNISFCIYKPFHYIREEFIEQYEKEFDWISEDNKLLKQHWREMGTINLMILNIMKRFESSINSFRLTIQKILNENINFLNWLTGKSTKKNIDNSTLDDFDDDGETEEDLKNFKKYSDKFKKEHFDLIKYEDDLKSDIEKMTDILNKYSLITPLRDGKLKELINQIINKINNPINKNNNKVIVFTSYIDTAEYLYENIKSTFENENIFSLLVTGSKCVTNHPELKDEKIEFDESLTYFSPISKELEIKKSLKKNVNIDILIATDCISEGQNLQDCDFLINYDVHWNPVRLIQRFGRIDRIGSKNKEIQMGIFWPNIDLEEYIKLESKIHSKMMRMSKTSSSDVDILELSIEESVTLNQLKQLEEETVGLEEIKGDVSLSSITLSEFTTDLKLELEKNLKKYMNQPDGIFSIANNNLNDYENGVIFLFESLKKENTFNALAPYYLVYVSNNKEVKITHEEPIEILRVYKSIAKQFEINKNLVDEFNQATMWGKNMKEYCDLLNIALDSIKKNNKSSDFLKIIDNDYEWIENDNGSGFNLISFLIIK